MILRRYSSLGLLPEVIVFACLACEILLLSYCLWKVLVRTPVILVPDAQGVHRIAPARADPAYMRAFALDFLQHWASWNHFNYRYRQSIAICMMTPSVRRHFTAAATQADGLVDSLQQSETLRITTVDIGPRDAHGSYPVTFAGSTQAFFGGVGGDPDPVRGALLLHEIAPTVANPLCLEVTGFLLQRPGSAASPASPRPSASKDRS